jgi:secondary thiamine-phosphate synthase enzyme
MIEKTLASSRRCEVLDITAGIAAAVCELGLDSGIAVVYCPHTTAGIAINEGFDPDVCDDILARLAALVPERSNFKHSEGNADAHIKATLVGSSQTIIVEKGSLVLGRWQRVFFCEFDGPRNRRYCVQGVPI